MASDECARVEDVPAGYVMADVQFPPLGTDEQRNAMMGQTILHAWEDATSTCDIQNHSRICHTVLQCSIVASWKLLQ